MSIVVESGWFIVGMVVFNYSFKLLGGKRTFWWLFAVSSLMCLLLAFPFILHIVYRPHGFLTLRTLLVPGVLSILATIYGLAWWAVWKRKPYARASATAASVAYILLSLFTIWSKLDFSRSIRGCTWFMLATGVIGLVVFLPRGATSGRTEPVHN